MRSLRHDADNNELTLAGSEATDPTARLVCEPMVAFESQTTTKTVQHEQQVRQTQEHQHKLYKTIIKPINTIFYKHIKLMKTNNHSGNKVAVLERARSQQRKTTRELFQPLLTLVVPSYNKKTTCKEALK